MTDYTLPKTQIEQRSWNAIFALVTRRRFLLIALVIAAVIVGRTIEVERHAGSFSDDFSADWDVNRLDYKLAGARLSFTAHEIYLVLPGAAQRIPLWRP